MNVVHAFAGTLGQGIGTVSRVKFTRVCFDACEYRPVAAANAIFMGVDVLLVVCASRSIRRPTSVIPLLYQTASKVSACYDALRMYRKFPHTPPYLYGDPTYSCDDGCDCKDNG